VIYLIFDYDGTVNDPVSVFAPGFRATFGKYFEEHGIDASSWTDARIASWFGVSMKVMLSDLLSVLDEKTVRNLLSDMTADVRRRIKEGGQSLFPGIVQVLEELRLQGFGLILLSKCDREHMDRQRRDMALDSLFDGFFCTGDIGDLNTVEKAEVFPYIREKFKGEYIVIGDRSQDMELANQWGLPSIGCAYGYGSSDETEASSRIAERACDIPTLVREIVSERGWQ